MRRILALILASGLAACVSASPEGGVANYDALKSAQEKCVAKGGTLKLQKGGDSQLLEDYSCKVN
jgi:hypothetical protein